MSVEKVLIEKISPNPFNPRHEYSEDSIAEMAQAMKESGVFAGTLRGRRVNGSIELCFGHRRLRAMKKAGIRHAEVEIEDLTDEQMETQSLIENIQRVDLSEIEKADAVAKLCQRRTQAVVSKLLGLSQGYIGHLCRISELPQSIKKSVEAGKLDAKAATMAHRIGGTGFTEKVIISKIGQPTVQEIASAIGKIPSKEIREKVKESAAKGHIKSAADVAKKAVQYSKRKKDNDKIPDVSSFLIGLHAQLRSSYATLEGLLPVAYAVRQSSSWKGLEEQFSKWEKAINTIRKAPKPKDVTAGPGGEQGRLLKE